MKKDPTEESDMELVLINGEPICAELVNFLDK